MYGTHGYYAPEFLLPGVAALSYDCTADIWSLGCILYELAIGRRVFEHDYHTWRYKETGILPAMEFNDDSFSDQEKETIESSVKRMLCLEPKERPAATDLITEFSLNYEQATATQPQHIQIYEDFRAVRQEVRSTPDGLTTRTAIAAFTTTRTEAVAPNPVFSERERAVQFLSPQLSNFSRISSLDDKMAFVFRLSEEDPTNFWIWHALSTLYADSNDLPGAINMFEYQFKKSPTNPAICMELINLHAANGNYDKGVEYGDRLLRMTPATVRNTVVRPEDPEVVEIIHNFKAKEESLKLQVTATLLSDSFRLRPKINVNFAFLKQWLSQNATFEPNIVDYRRRAQLLHAGWSGNKSKIVDLDRTDFAEIPDKDGHDALKWAAANMHFEFAQTLLSFANTQSFLHPVDDLNWESIHYASANGDSDMISLLLEWGLDIDSGLSAHGPSIRSGLGVIHPVHLAAASPASLEALKAWPAVEHLLKKDGSGRSVMHWAVESKHVPTMEYLMNCGLEIDSTDEHGRKPIHIAADRGHVEVVQWLKRWGATAFQYDLDGYLPIHLAAKNGHLAVLQYLRDGAGMDVVAKGGQDHDVRHKVTGDHPLHLAARHGRIEVVRYLMQIGGSVDPSNAKSETPLHLAAEGGHIDVVQYLISQDADMDATQPPDWETPLHKAARRGHVEVIRILEESGADLKALNFELSTALHLAAEYGHVAAARQLKSMGADLTTRDDENRTPSKRAFESDYEELAKELAPPKSKNWFKRLFNCTHHFPLKLD